MMSLTLTKRKLHFRETTTTMTTMTTNCAVHRMRFVVVAVLLVGIVVILTTVSVGNETRILAGTAVTPSTASGTSIQPAEAVVSQRNYPSRSKNDNDSDDNMSQQQEPCQAAAAVANVRYQSPYSQWDGKSDLNTYLDTNGLLVSMCTPILPDPSTNTTMPSTEPLPIRCGLDKSQISSSWIQQGTTGIRLVDFLNDHHASTGYGGILDPAAVQVRCVFPADADTKQRTNDGCGTIKRKLDQLSPSVKASMQKAFVSSRNARFGTNTSWTEIGCRELFSIDYPFSLPKDTTILRRNESVATTLNCSNVDPPREDLQDMRFLDHTEYQTEMYTALMGQPVCRPDETNQREATDIQNEGPLRKIDDDSFVLLLSDCAWTDQHWNEMIRLMRFINKLGHGTRNWNELILQPLSAASPVEAIFFLQSQSFSYEIQAKLLHGATREAVNRHLPLLAFHMDTESFSCNSTRTTMSVV